MLPHRPPTHYSCATLPSPIFGGNPGTLSRLARLLRPPSRPKPFPAIHIIVQRPPRTPRPATTPSLRKFPSPHRTAPHRRAPAPEPVYAESELASACHTTRRYRGARGFQRPPCTTRDRPPPSSGKPNLSPSQLPTTLARSTSSCRRPSPRPPFRQPTPTLLCPRSEDEICSRSMCKFSEMDPSIP